MAGVKFFVGKINAGRGGCIRKIVRIKNGFRNIKNWKKLSDYGYCDLKFNVLVSNNDISVIGEIQCMLDFFLESKKRIHSLYQLKRKSEFIKNVNFMYENNDLNVENYQAKLLSIFQSKTLYDKLGMELLLNDRNIFKLKAPISKTDRVFSTISLTAVHDMYESKSDANGKSGDTKSKSPKDNSEALVPIFYHIYQTRWTKGFKLFFGALMYYSGLVSNKENETQFAQEYFNDKCALTIEQNKKLLFWGLQAAGFEFSRYTNVFTFLLKQPLMHITV